MSGKDGFSVFDYLNVIPEDYRIKTGAKILTFESRRARRARYSTGLEARREDPELTPYLRVCSEPKCRLELEWLEDRPRCPQHGSTKKWLVWDKLKQKVLAEAELEPNWLRGFNEWDLLVIERRS